MPRSINEAVREVCLSFPEAVEVISHGSPDFRVRGKTFASYVVNHHGDGRVALWLNSPAGAQDHYSKSQPRHFFVPPYVGPRGWLGVHLNKGLSWQRVAELVRQAYEKVAPPALAKSIGATIAIKLPVAALSAEQIDPLKSRRAKAVLAGVRKLVADWPEVAEDQQFGSPVWRAGKKTFLWLHADRSAAVTGRKQPRLQIYFWVGVGAQGLMTTDPRFEIPAYLGHQGWIAFDVSRDCDWSYVRGLALGSYRHFALARMLKKLAPHED
ncbi:MAG: MmcQ/YjbR family DNA-binding protein [Proteobacteria bacterium]|nr:MmcQ/YjbR family DNA-binding protein [Pseudomonadota bacterium]